MFTVSFNFKPPASLSKEEGHLILAQGRFAGLQGGLTAAGEEAVYHLPMYPLTPASYKLKLTTAWAFNEIQP